MAAAAAAVVATVVAVVPRFGRYTALRSSDEIQAASFPVHAWFTELREL